MYPHDLQVVDMVQVSLVRLGRPLEALDFLNSLDPALKEDLQIRVTLAYIHLGLNDVGPAQALWSEYKDLPKNERPLSVNLLAVLALQTSGLHEDLLLFVKANLFAKENFAEVLVIAADAAYRIREWGMFEEIMQELEGFSGTTPTVHLMRARFLMKDGRYQEAREHLDQGLSVLPSDKALLIDKARVQVSLGEVQDAKERFFLLFNAYPDDPVICMNLAVLPAELYAQDDPTAVMFLDRMVYLLVGKPLGAVPPKRLMELLREHGRDIGYFNLVEQFPRLGSGMDPTEGDLLRNVLPFVSHARLVKTTVDHGSDLAHLIVESYLGQPGSCYIGIDEVLMTREVEPSAMQDYYYALTAAQIIEDHSAVAPAALARARSTMASDAATPTEMYYALLLLAMYNEQDVAQARLKALRTDPRWNVLLHLLELRLRAENNPAFLASAVGEQALGALVDHMHREVGCYFLNPTPILVPKHGREVLEPITPLFQFMENLELLSHVSEFVRSFQKDQTLNEIYFVRGSIFARLLEFEAYEEVRALGLVDPDIGGFTPAAVSWVGTQLSRPLENLDINALVQARNDEPGKLLSEMGRAVFNSINGTWDRREVTTLTDTLKCVRENYTLCTALLQHGRIDIEQCLLFQHYCQYALEHLVRTDTGAVEKELKVKLDDELLDLLKQLDIIGTLLELAIGPVRPFYWICAKGIKAITKALGAEVIGDRFLSFDQYSEYVNARRSKEAA